MMQISAKTRTFLLFVLCLLGILGVLFLPSFEPAKVLFSNDGPLGARSMDSGKGWALFTGMWADLNFLGTSGEATLRISLHSSMSRWGLLVIQSFTRF